MLRRRRGLGSWKTAQEEDSDEYEYQEKEPRNFDAWSKLRPKKPPATSYDKAESELAKKKAALKHYGLDDPTDPNRDDRNFVEKAFNTPKNTGFLGDIFDVLSRGQYTSANLAKNFARDIKENGASEILKRANPFYSLKKTFGEEGREAIKEGITGERKGSYDEVLDEAGMKKGLGRSALGFVGDVALDPTTYLSLGGTAVGKVGGKAVGATVKLSDNIVQKSLTTAGGKNIAKNLAENGLLDEQNLKHLDTAIGAVEKSLYKPKIKNVKVKEIAPMVETVQPRLSPDLQALVDSAATGKVDQKLLNLVLKNKSDAEAKEIFELIKNPALNIKTAAKPKPKILPVNKQEVLNKLKQTKETRAEQVAYLADLKTMKNHLLNPQLKGSEKALVSFAGNTLLKRGETLDNIIGNVGEKIRSTKAGEILGKGLIPGFREAGTDALAHKQFQEGLKELRQAKNLNQKDAIKEVIERVGPNLTKVEREQLSRLFEFPEGFSKASDKVQEAYGKARNIFNERRELELSNGLFVPKKDNYLPHYYENANAIPKMPAGDFRTSEKLRNQLQSSFKNLDEAEQAGAKPIKDFYTIAARRLNDSKNAVSTKEFVNKTVRDLGVKLEKGDMAPNGWGVHAVSTTITENGKVIPKTEYYALPKQIAEELNNLNKVPTNTATKKIVNLLVDKPTNLWKAYATAVNPGFHIRNAASNMYQAYLNNAPALLNPLNHAKALGINVADKAYLGKVAPFLEKFNKGSKQVDIKRKTYTLAEFKQLMEREGAINKGFFDNDIEQALQSKINSELGLKNRATTYLKNTPIKDQAKDLAGTLLKAPLAPFKTDNALIKTGRYFGGGVENQGRAFNFLSEVKRNGGDIKEAVKNTDKFFFDYDELTDFEKDYIKKVVPFWTWMRKDVPLQVEQLVKQPGKYAAVPKLINAVENQSKQPDETYLPDYMKNWVRTPFEQSKNPVYLNPNLPYGDLDRLNPAEFTKNVLGSLTPLAKVPWELATNKNSFFGDKIERFEGQTKSAPGYLGDEKLPRPLMDLLGAKVEVNKDTGKEELVVPAKTRYLMSQVPFLENISKAMDYEGDKKFNQLLSFIAGAKVAPYEIEKQKKNKTYSDRDKLREFFDLLEAQNRLPDDWSKKIQKKKETKKGW